MKIHSADDAEKSPEAYEEAFCNLFEREFPSLFRYLHRVTGDRDLAEDIAQEAFVRLYQRGALPDDVRGWMGAVANNLLRDQHRTGKRRLRLLEAGSGAPEMERASRAADEDLLSEERKTLVRRALSQLAERDRRMLLLRHEGYSYREIAHAVGVNEKSIGTLLLRATAAFRAAFGAAPPKSESRRMGSTASHKSEMPHHSTNPQG